jgi:hypothetical protein
MVHSAIQFAGRDITGSARYAGKHARQGSPTTVHTVGSLTHMVEVLGMCSGRKVDAIAITQPMDAKGMA